MPGMATRVALPPVNDTTGHGSTQDSLVSLLEVIRGYPETVHADKDPLWSRPEDLNAHRWYLVRSDQIGDLDVGSWRQKEEPRRMMFLSMPMAVCWEISLAFHDGHGPETDWMMLQYFITISNGTLSVCRIGTDPRNDAQVGGPVPLDDDGLRSTDHPIPGAGNQSDSDIFYVGDFMELLDLDTPLFPPMDSE